MELDIIDLTVRLPDVDALLELINSGEYDEHLEAILAAGHARKRARRGVRRPYGVSTPLPRTISNRMPTSDALPGRRTG